MFTKWPFNKKLRTFAVRMNRMGRLGISKHGAVQLRDQPAPYWIVEDLARLWGICSSPKSKQNISSKFSYVTLILVPKDHISPAAAVACISIARSANNWNTYVSYFTFSNLTLLHSQKDNVDIWLSFLFIYPTATSYLLRVLCLWLYYLFLCSLICILIKYITDWCWLKHMC